MITLLERDGVLVRIDGNPTLTSLDGEVRAPLAVILHESWTDEDRAKFGIYQVHPPKVPSGKRVVGEISYVREGNGARAVMMVEDAPKQITREKPDPLSSLIERVDILEKTVARLLEANPIKEPKA